MRLILRISLLFFHLLIILSANAQFVDLKSSEFSQAKFNSYIIAKRVMDLTNLPGMAISVSYKGEIIYSEGFGYEDIERRIYVRPDTTIFRLADMSKPISSVLMMMLVEEGKLDLDSPVLNYVDYFSHKDYPFTLRQLACHTAGIRPLGIDEKYIDRDFSTLKKGIKLFRKDKLLFKPETEFLYSDHGWSLIGASIEHAFGYDFKRIIEDQLLDDLSIENIYLEGFGTDIANMAKGYAHDQYSDIQYAVQANYSHVSPGMAFASSANALLKFANSVMYSKTIHVQSRDAMLEPCTLRNGDQLSYALGWMINEDHQGRKWYGHSGSGVGSSGMLLIYPDHELVIVVLLNLTDAKIRDVPFKIADQFISIIDSKQ